MIAELTRIDLTQPVEDSHDPSLLNGLLSALVGQPCLRAGLSYGGELMIHFGTPRSYTHPKLADMNKGSWILGLRGSGWRLLLPEPPTIIEAGWPLELRHWPAGWGPIPAKAAEKPASEEDTERAVQQLAGEIVTFVRPFPQSFPPAATGVALVLAFANGANLVVSPLAEPDEDGEPLADWELFTPHHTYLRCGPGFVWSYLRSDQTNGGKKKT